MLKLIFRRLLEAVPTLLVLITVSFFMMRLAPVQPVYRRAQSAAGGAGQY